MHWIVENSDGDVIHQKAGRKPEQPDDYDGEWKVKEIEKENLNERPVNWWMD